MTKGQGRTVAHEVGEAAGDSLQEASVEDVDVVQLRWVRCQLQGKIQLL